jgi:FkbM family methyltransferase
MNIKVFIGEIIKKTGFLHLSLYVSKKLGYLHKFTDHHAHGIDLAYDIKQDTSIQNIKTVVDVGASIGTMTTYFLDTFPACKVYSFEPYSPSFHIIANIFQNNPRVSVHQLALSDEPGEVKMYIQEDSGYNSLKEPVNKPSEKMVGKFEVVKVGILDEFCAVHNIDRIDFLKIDTEGLDLNVLKGASKMLKARKIKYIYVESTFDKDNVQNTQFNDLADYLHDYGFKVRAIYDQSNYGNKSYLTCANSMFYLQPL